MKKQNLSKAPVYKRFLADVIDGCIIALLSFILFFAVKNAMAEQMLGLLIFLAYDVGLTYLNSGATLGKKIFKIKVVALHGKLILPQIVIMSLSNAIASLVLLYALLQFTGNAWYAPLMCTGLFILIMVIDFKNRALQDLVARTWVVKTKSS